MGRGTQAGSGNTATVWARCAEQVMEQVVEAFGAFDKPAIGTEKCKKRDEKAKVNRGGGAAELPRGRAPRLGDDLVDPQVVEAFGAVDKPASGTKKCKKREEKAKINRGGGAAVMPRGRAPRLGDDSIDPIVMLGVGVIGKPRQLEGHGGSAGIEADGCERHVRVAAADGSPGPFPRHGATTTVDGVGPGPGPGLLDVSGVVEGRGPTPACALVDVREGNVSVGAAPQRYATNAVDTVTDDEWYRQTLQSRMEAELSACSCEVRAAARARIDLCLVEGASE